jgi:biopolymer transport protein ExbD
MSTADRLTPDSRRFSIRMSPQLWTGMVTVLVIVVGCGRDSVSPSQSARPQAERAPLQATKVVKVKVSASGEITADGDPVTLDQLAAKLGELKQMGGEVWYYRENPTAEPHLNAMKVIELVAQNKLPVRLTLKATALVPEAC